MKYKLIAGALMVVMLFSTGCSREVIRKNNSNKVEDTSKPIVGPAEAETEEPDNGETFVEIPSTVTSQPILLGLSKGIIDVMTLEEKVGQLFMVNLEALDTSNGSYYEFRSATDQMIENLKKYHIGGVTLFSRNIETRDQTKQLIKQLQKESGIRLFISVDEEGGEVARIANNSNMNTTKFPNMEVVGATNDLDYAYKIGSTIGEEIRQLGFNVDFAPVADVKTNAYNTEIGSRSFSSDESVVSQMVIEIVKGLQEQGISATLKHFPGQGSSSLDSHQQAVNLDTDINSFRKVEFKPFQAGIKAGTDFVMVSHVSVSKISGDTTPASMCSVVMNEMLRTELGFTGIVITDAMDMKCITEHYNAGKAAVNALKAGADMILIPENFAQAYDAVLEAVKSGEISEDDIDAKLSRILITKIKRGIITEDSQIVERVYQATN